MSVGEWYVVICFSLAFICFCIFIYAITHKGSRRGGDQSDTYHVGFRIGPKK